MSDLSMMLGKVEPNTLKEFLEQELTRWRKREAELKVELDEARKPQKKETLGTVKHLVDLQIEFRGVLCYIDAYLQVQGYLLGHPDQGGPDVAVRPDPT